MTANPLVRLFFCGLLATFAVSAQAQTYTVLYTFGNVSLDPIQPGGIGTIAQGRDGNLYTTSTDGGVGNVGALFNVSPSGVMTLIFSFNYAPGNDPLSGVTLGSDGNYYGTTKLNGEGPGTAWQVTPAGTGKALHYFGNSGDGACPWAGPIEGTNGNYYGTTTTVCGFGSQSTIYTLTSSGALTTLYTFTDGSNLTAPLVQGTDGNFYGVTESGGVNGDGSVFRMTPSGTVTILHSFDGTDGNQAYTGLIQASDGNFYGVTDIGGSSNAGVVFKISSSGAYTVLHNFNGTTDGGQPWGLMQATNGTLYGVAESGGSGYGTIYSLTSSGTFTVLHNFVNTDGATPSSPLKQNTNGILYGDTNQGGNVSLCGGTGCGVFYSLNIGAKPFVTLSSTAGKVGSQVGIFGQGFSKSSVVKFNGTQVTKATLSGTTFITATVPAGATDGFVTVTTGSTTLTSSQKYTVHNSWANGAAMPTGTMQSAAAVLGGEVFVVGGYNTSGTVLSNVQIYNPSTNTWSAGPPLPTATGASSAAVVNNILYVFGGSTSTAVTGTVWAYSTKTKTWTSMAPMPTPRNGTLAVVEKNIVYVMGGNLGNGANFVATVESYNPATNTWTEETSMDGAKDYAGGGLIGTTIVVADGAVNSGVITGDTEGYTATTNEWSELTADPTIRTGVCAGVIGSALYDATGYVNNAGAATTANEAFSLSTNKWTTTLAPIPQGVMWPTPAVDNGQLYCFGGWTTLNGSTINNVQIYQP
jgi:uncharacterized repeat protein (TIGR03803 family)